METIPIFTEVSANSITDDEHDGVYQEPTLNSSQKRLETQLQKVDAGKFKDSLQSLTGQLSAMFDDISAVGNYNLNKVEVGLELSVEGGVALIGLAKAGAKATIKLTFDKNQ